MWRRLHKETLVIHTTVNKRYHHNKNYICIEMERVNEMRTDGESGSIGKAGVHRSASSRSRKSSNSTSSGGSIAGDKHGALAEDAQVENLRLSAQGQLQLQEIIGTQSKKPKKKPTLKVNAHEDRDPNNIAAAVKISFEDIIGEPDRNLYSFDEPWNASQIAYAGCRLWWYRIMTLICGVPVACCWGVVFACLSCCASWCWAPQLRAFQLVMSYGRLFVEGVINCLVEPCCFACGIYFSRFRVVHEYQGKDEQHIV